MTKKKILLRTLVFAGSSVVLMCLYVGWMVLAGTGINVSLVNNSGGKVYDIRISYTIGEENVVENVKELGEHKKRKIHIEGGRKVHFHKIQFGDSSKVVYDHKLNFYVPFELDAQLKITFLPKGKIDTQDEMWLVKLGPWKY